MGPKITPFLLWVGLVAEVSAGKNETSKKERDISTMTPKTHEKLQVLGTPPPKKKSLDTLFFHIYFHFFSFLSCIWSKKISDKPSRPFVEWNSTSPPTLCFHITHRNLLFVRCFQELHIWPAKLIAACLRFFRRRRSFHLFLCPKKRLSAKKTKGESSILQGKSHKKKQRSDFKKVERGNCPTDLF